MELDIVHLEVDGSLSNPASLAAVIAWTTILSAVTWLLVSWIEMPRPSPAARRRTWRRVAYSFLACLFLSTFITQQILADVFYRFIWVNTGPLWSVGFWGGPPMSPAIGISALMGILSLRRETARELRAQQLPK